MISIKQIEKLSELSKLEFSQEDMIRLESELNEQLENITNEQILQAAWDSTYLGRIDGVRFLPSFKDAKSYEELCKKTRIGYFDWETKKKILIGYYVILEENYNEYFGKVWKKDMVQEVNLSDLRDDEIEPSMERKKIMKEAPNSTNEYFVVPLVVDND